MLRVMVPAAAWSAVWHSPRLARAIVRAPTNKVPSASASTLGTWISSVCAKNFGDAARWWRRPCTNARTAVTFVGERRCTECNLFTRAIGLGGHCPECEAPVLVVDLLGGEGVVLTR